MTDEEIMRLVEETGKGASPIRNESSGCMSCTRNECAGAACGIHGRFCQVLVLIPENTYFPKESAMKQISGDGRIVLAGFGPRAPEGYQYYNLEDGQCVRSLLDSLEEFAIVYLFAPGFAMMNRLAQLQDDELVLRILLQAVLSGKRARILFEQDTDSLPSGLYRNLHDLLRKIENLGITVFNDRLCSKGEKGEDGNVLRKLLLEEDIITLHMQGQADVTVGRDCILTPLATDKARELGMRISRS